MFVISLQCLLTVRCFLIYLYEVYENFLNNAQVNLPIGLRTSAYRTWHQQPQGKFNGSVKSMF